MTSVHNPFAHVGTVAFLTSNPNPERGKLQAYPRTVDVDDRNFATLQVASLPQVGQVVDKNGMLCHIKSTSSKVNAYDLSNNVGSNTYRMFENDEGLREGYGPKVISAVISSMDEPGSLVETLMTFSGMGIFSLQAGQTLTFNFPQPLDNYENDVVFYFTDGHSPLRDTTISAWFQCVIEPFLFPYSAHKTAFEIPAYAKKVHLYGEGFSSDTSVPIFIWDGQNKLSAQNIPSGTPIGIDIPEVSSERVDGTLTLFLGYATYNAPVLPNMPASWGVQWEG